MMDVQIYEVPAEPVREPLVDREQFVRCRKVHEAMETVYRVETFLADNYRLFEGSDTRQRIMEVDRILVKNAREILIRHTGNPRGFLTEEAHAVKF